MIATQAVVRRSAAATGATRTGTGAAAALGVFVLLAIVHTWPLATNPAHLSRNDTADAVLNEWTLAWVAHQLPKHPLALFDANIFHPEHLTLAYSEAMIVQSVLAMPILAAGGSPVLAYNLTLIAGFALTGWAFCLLLRFWTGRWMAGYASGSLAAFNAHSLVRLAHLQAQHVEFIAGILFLLDRVVVSRRWRDAAWLGVVFALEALTSVYLLVFTTWVAVFSALGRMAGWARRRPWQMFARFAGAAGVAVVLLTPYLWGYGALHFRSGVERSADEVMQFSATWHTYLLSGSRLHFAWSQPFFATTSSAAFPGVIGLALTLLALASPGLRRDPRVQMCLSAAVGCALVSFAPLAPFYPALHRAIPLFRAVRVLSHISQMVLLMVAVIAGFGMTALLDRLPAGRAGVIVGCVAIALINAEALRAPLDYASFTEVPRVYDRLATAPGAVVELPLFPPREFFENAPYMLNSTHHWRPLINGYSGIRPDSYDDTFRAVNGFPDDRSLIALHERGVTDIVVHESAFAAMNGNERYQAIWRTESLAVVAEDGDIHVFRLR